MRLTKITASIGPKSESTDVLKQLMDNGVSMFRLNFSHDTGDMQGARIKTIRQLGKPVAIVADMQGPKNRISCFEGGSTTLVAGETFVFDNDSKLGDNTRVFLPDANVLKSLSVGDTILLNDGKQEFTVTETNGTKVTTKIIRGGTIKDKRGFNLPNTEIDASVLTEKDRVDLAYAITQDIDYVAISFVQKPEDISEVRDFITQRTNKPIKIISKIERPQALARIDDIIKNSDAIMVARGDLAVEVPFYKVPEITRNLIRKCRYLNKPIIVATQMLASMIENEFPTRAEISDVANAAYLRADSTMTSEETTIGMNPPHVIDTMAKILENADEDEVHNHYNGGIKSYHDNAWSKSVVDLAELNSAVAIVVFTHGGTNARTISSRCPDIPIVAVCSDAIIANQLCLHRGIFPVIDAKLLNDQDYATAVAKIGINNGPVVIICDDKITLGRV